MLARTPMLRPAPMEIGDIFASTMTVFKARLGTLIAVTALPIVVFLLGGAAIVALVTTGAVQQIDAHGSTLPAWVIAVAAGVLVYMAAYMLSSYKALAMIAAATYEVGQGQRPTFSSLLTSTKGFLPRMATLVLLFFGVGVVIYGAIFAVAFSVFAASDSPSATATAGGLVALLVFALIAVGIPLALFLSVKLLYVVQIVTIEGLGGIAALKRSWQLTNGAFWRTLGYYLIASLIIQAVAGLVSGVSQIAMTPALVGLEDIGSDPTAIWAALTPLIPIYTVAILLQLTVALFSVPFQQIYITAMYIDQVRRGDLPTAAPMGFQPGAPTAGWQAPPPPPPTATGTAWQAPPPPPAPSDLPTQQPPRSGTTPTDG